MCPRTQCSSWRPAVYMNAGRLTPRNGWDLYNFEKRSSEPFAIFTRLDCPEQLSVVEIGCALCVPLSRPRDSNPENVSRRKFDSNDLCKTTPVLFRLLA